MGMSPGEVLALPLHDYQAAIFHFNKDRAGEEEGEDEALNDFDFDEMQVAMAAQGIH